MRIILAALLASVLCSKSRAQTESPPAHRLEGQAALMSNLVEYGVSQTNKDPALQGAFWFGFGPQFRLGVIANNVSYAGSPTHFLIRGAAELRAPLSENVDMTLFYQDHHYFPQDDRDGNVFGIALRFWDAGVRYEQIANFMAYGSAKAYALYKITDVFQTWKWENRIGTVQPDDASLTPFYYYETYLGTKSGAIFYQLGGSFNSSASQFNGAGDPNLVMKASISF